MTIFTPSPDRPAFAKGVRSGCRIFPAKDTLLLSYQEKWVADNNIDKWMEKSRRIGISWATAYRRVKLHATKGRRFDSWVSSRDETSAKLFVGDCLKFAKPLNVAAKDLGLQIMEDDKGAKHTVHSIHFSTFTEIHSVSSNPDAFAGKGGDVTLDEMALRKDPMACDAIAQPSTDWGGQVERISTHRGNANYFARRLQQLREEKPPGTSIHRITLEDALNCGLLYKLQQRYHETDPRFHFDEQQYFDYIRKRCPNEETFLQEYCCLPADDGAAFLPYELIDQCCYGAGEDWRQVSPGATTTLGIDIGRDHDLTVMTLLEWQGTMAYVRRIVEIQGEPFDAQERHMARLIEEFDPFAIAIDATGLGRQFAERAEQQYGRRVEQVKFTPATKEEMAYPLRGKFEDRSLRIPRSRELEADLRSIKKESGPTHVKFYADRGKNGHADRFWSLALAVRAFAQGGQFFEIILPDASPDASPSRPLLAESSRSVI